MNIRAKKEKSAIIVLSGLVLVIIITIVIVSFSNRYQFEIIDTSSKVDPDSFNIIIYTDIHHDPSYEIDPWMATLNCIQAVSERAPISSFWNLGDVINGHTSTKAEAIAQIREVTDFEDKISPNFHRIQGNHDNNIQATYEENAGYSESEVLTPRELNEVLENRITSQTEHHNLDRLTDYYVDFPDLRIVCISVDNTSFTSETVKWLRTEGLATGKPVLILSHIPTRPEWGFHNDVRNGEYVEDALKDFLDNGGTIIAYIYGHDHGDMISQVLSNDGETLWNEICIACSRFHVPSSNGTPGMTFWERNKDDATLIIFDVVSIDFENRTVKFTRFGAGEDREIHY